MCIRDRAYALVDRKLVEIIRKSLANIRTYHEKQRQTSWFDSKPDGTILGQKVTALHRVGAVSYTHLKRRRSTDAYTPGGVMGKRPDYAVTVYGNLIRQVYKKTPIILGGIEASLRRLAHYDYWSNKLKRSVLLDSGADIISYGMGEHSIIEIAEALDLSLIHISSHTRERRRRENQYPYPRTSWRTFRSGDSQTAWKWT